MADSPTKEYPQHGGQGNGPYGAGYPDNQLTTPNIRGRRLGGHDPAFYSTNYPSNDTSSHVHPPTDTDAETHFIHPFKLQRYSKTLSTNERYLGLGGDADPSVVKTLRVYYGELWSTVSVIKTSATLVADASLSPGASDPNVNVYGISSQLEIPGINRTVIPQFANTDGGDNPEAIRREVHRFIEFSEKFDKKGGEAESDGGAYGIVILKFHVNVDESSDTPVGEITRAYIELVPTTDDIGDDQLIEELSEKEKGEGGDAEDGLRRENDKEGIYTVVIGESRDMELTEEDPDNRGEERLVNEGRAPIDQQVYDNIYWSTTIVVGSDSVSDPPQTPPPPPITSTPYTSYPPVGVVAVEPPPRNIVVINGNRDVQGS